MENNDYIFIPEVDKCVLSFCKRHGTIVEIPKYIISNYGTRFVVASINPREDPNPRPAGGIFVNPDIVREIFIPASVKVLGYGCFMNCSSLEKVSFENGCVLTEVGTNVFNGCSSLRECVLPITHTTSINEYDIRCHINITRRYMDNGQ